MHIIKNLNMLSSFSIQLIVEIDVDIETGIYRNRHINITL